MVDCNDFPISTAATYLINLNVKSAIITNRNWDSYLAIKMFVGIVFIFLDIVAVCSFCALWRLSFCKLHIVISRWRELFSIKGEESIHCFIKIFLFVTFDSKNFVTFVI